MSKNKPQRTGEERLSPGGRKVLASLRQKAKTTHATYMLVVADLRESVRKALVELESLAACTEKDDRNGWAYAFVNESDRQVFMARLRAYTHQFLNIDPVAASA